MEVKNRYIVLVKLYQLFWGLGYHVHRIVCGFTFQIFLILEWQREILSLGRVFHDFPEKIHHKIQWRGPLLWQVLSLLILVFDSINRWGFISKLIVV